MHITSKSKQNSLRGFMNFKRILPPRINKLMRTIENLQRKAQATKNTVRFKLIHEDNLLEFIVNSKIVI